VKGDTGREREREEKGGEWITSPEERVKFERRGMNGWLVNSLLHRRTKKEKKRWINESIPNPASDKYVGITRMRVQSQAP